MERTWAILSEQGLRSYMEDAHFFDLNFGSKGWVFGGVYDGHGGAYAAEYAAQYLHERFLEILLAGSSPEDAFVKSYETISDELAHQDSGACAATFFIRNGGLFFANAGDARIIAIREGTVHQLTIDHRLDNEDERRRIESYGGRIVYPYATKGAAGLMPTRTLGDAYFKPIGITATPAVGAYALEGEKAWVVAATDGLFDVMSNEEVAAVLAKGAGDPNSLVEILKREIFITRRGSDNVTAILLKV